ncbi:unnamed protein product, partial [Ectocarpus sp. 12 AP-2014]
MLGGTFRRCTRICERRGHQGATKRRKTVLYGSNRNACRAVLEGQQTCTQSPAPRSRELNAARGHSDKRPATGKATTERSDEQVACTVFSSRHQHQIASGNIGVRECGITATS